MPRLSTRISLLSTFNSCSKMSLLATLAALKRRRPEESPNQESFEKRAAVRARTVESPFSGYRAVARAVAQSGVPGVAPVSAQLEEAAVWRGFVEAGGLTDVRVSSYQCP